MTQYRFASIVCACGRRLATAVILGCLTGPAAPAVDEALVARYTPWFMPPEIWNPKLSPNGDYLGFQLRDGDDYAIGIYDFSKRMLSVSSGSGKFFPVDYWWKGTRRLMVRIRKTSNVNEHTVTAFDVDGANPEELWHMNQHRGWIVDSLPQDPKHVLVTYSNEVMRVDITSGKWTRVAGDIGLVRYWVLDKDRQPRAAYSRDIDLGHQILWWRTAGAKKWRHIETGPDARGFMPVAFDSDPRHLWVWDFEKYPNIRLSKFDTETGSATPVFGGSGLHPTRVLRLDRSGQAVAAVYSQLEPEKIEALSDAIRPAVERLNAKFAGYAIDLVDSLPDGRTWIVRAESSRFPGGFFMFDSEGGGLTPIASTYSPALKESLFVPSRIVSVHSRSGGEIRGRVWMPREAKNPPVVVVCPPRFPAAPAADRFDPFIQALCDRGFAVVRFDTRGTYGYGAETELLATGTVAQVLREDYEDGVAGLAEQGVVDGNRAALLGFDLGGALAIAIAEDGGGFKAVVAVNPPRKIERDDLVRLSIDSSLTVISDRLGGWRASAEAARALSPLSVAPRLRVPALFLLDEEDWGSNRLSSDAKALSRAMKAAGAPDPTEGDTKALSKAILASGAPVTVATAFKWHENVTPPSATGPEGAAMAARIIEFLDSALAR